MNIKLMKIHARELVILANDLSENHYIPADRMPIIEHDGGLSIEWGTVLEIDKDGNTNMTYLGEDRRIHNSLAIAKIIMKCK